MGTESRDPDPTSNESLESHRAHRFITVICAAVSITPAPTRSVPLPGKAFGDQDIADIYG
jgi:hypothetical protein